MHENKSISFPYLYLSLQNMNIHVYIYTQYTARPYNGTVFFCSISFAASTFGQARPAVLYITGAIWLRLLGLGFRV